MKTMAVFEVTRYIKDLLERDYYLGNVWIRGEISNFKRAASGHLYMTLKDEYSSIRVVMFKSRTWTLAFEPEDGMEVRIGGSISVYERSGMYQLYAREIEPAGSGALFAAFEQLKEKLQKEGLFDSRYKKDLPKFPGKIGLVTSPSGAAVRDIINILRRRWPGIEIILAPVKVQGDEAPGEICTALETMNSLPDVDLLITGRGGGSLEELWAFNTEMVCRSIFNSRIPVISAVGHETDFTLSDMTADLRAPTPSAAAEIAVPDRLELLRHLQGLNIRLGRTVSGIIQRLRMRLDNCRNSRALNRPVDILCNQRRQTVDTLQRQMINAITQKVNNDRGRLAAAAGRLDALSPLATLARGYSICTTPDGIVVRKSSEVEKGDPLNIRLHEGTLRCEVKDKN